MITCIESSTSPSSDPSSGSKRFMIFPMLALWSALRRSSIMAFALCWGMKFRCRIYVNDDVKACDWFNTGKNIVIELNGCWSDGAVWHKTPGRS